ncbi:MAG: nuclear transport factor 2 family protein [Alphaproteobacteria bacterium]|jgi:hypothetical protein|nr:nuclear transport factor 2 family protein [Alphaproteobacteria bacterium]
MQDTRNDEAAVREVVGWYFDGMYRSDPALIEKAFEPSARVMGVTDGEHREMAVADFMAFVGKQQPSAADKGEPFDMRILSLDITGGTAAVKLEDRYLGRDFIDYLLLVRQDDGWNICHKLWWA